MKSLFHRPKAKAANLEALQAEIARQLRGRLDVLWSVPPELAELLEELHARQTHPAS